MTWLEYHSQSEKYASDAQAAALRGESSLAQDLYAKAAEVEERALGEIAPDKPRTYSITAVSAVALYFKAAQWDKAKFLAYRCLGSEHLLGFAFRQIEGLLDSIRTEQAGIGFDDVHILVSVRGGEIVRGGAPMDLVIKKFQKIESLLYRTTEYMKKLPHRRRGGPRKDIKDSYRPWLFQAEPGSYQFSVTVQPTRQLELDMFDVIDVGPKQIVDRLFGILRACAESPRERLPEMVPEDDYRGAFLKLTRDLAPTGKDFGQLDIRATKAPRAVVLDSATREAINDIIRSSRPPSPGEEETEIRGVLRALHLDDDWIEVVTDKDTSLRIDGAGDEVDDRIGPMVNHPVVVSVTQKGEKYRFIDIEAE